jgi:DNA polymerase-3 subunit chi
VSTIIEFYSGIGDKVHHAARLLRKAYAKGARVALIGDAAVLERLDADLWTADPRDFVAHLRVDGSTMPAARMGRTPLWLADDPGAAHGCEVVVNLRREPLARVDGFARVIELVGSDDDDRRAGRARWRHYEAQGHTIEHRALDAPTLEPIPGSGTADR